MRKIFLIFFVFIFSNILVVCSSQIPPSGSEYQYHGSQERNIYFLGIQKQYLDYIIDGTKTVDGRVNLPDFTAMKIGDLICFIDNERNLAICTVISVGRYNSFNKMLVSEGVVKMLPQIDPDTNSSVEMVVKGVEIYRSFPGYEEGVKVYGAIAFDINYKGDELPFSYNVIEINEEQLIR